jgi:flagellar hook-associated protein 2
MGTTGSLVFTGISSYSSDFQTILQRAVSIAQLPVQSLQNQQTDNLNKKEALIALNPEVASLGSAVAALGSLAANGGGLQASSSNSSTVWVGNTGATAPATYTISNIQSLAAPAWATSSSFADTNKTAVSRSNLVDLTVGSNTYHLDLTGNNNLTGLEDAINNAGAGVTASILTVGTSNYLSISASAAGQAAIQLQAVPATTDLITNTGTGTDTSVTHYADTDSTPVSVSGQMSLVVGSNTYQLDLTGANNLTGLENAINNAGAGVTASILSDANGYYLSISTNDLSPQTLQVNDTAANLIASSDAGTNADFMLNGNIHVVRSSNVVNDVIPGVSFTLQNTTSGSVTLSLATDNSQLSSALQTFVSSYNNLVAQTNQQVGPSAGALGGDMLISNILSDMQQLATYWNPSGTSTVRSLSDLGITFDTTGHMSFDPTVFNGLSDSQLSDALNFLGSSSSGFAALASNFTQLSDPLTGMIQTQEDAYDSENTQLSDRITTLNDRVSQIQSSMTAKLQAADALVAQLESQQNTVNASVESLNYVAFGKQYTANGQ